MKRRTVQQTKDYVLTLRLRNTDYTAIRKVADEEERTLSATVRILVREALQAREDKAEKTQ